MARKQRRDEALATLQNLAPMYGTTVWHLLCTIWYDAIHVCNNIAMYDQKDDT